MHSTLFYLVSPSRTLEKLYEKQKQKPISPLSLREIGMLSGFLVEAQFKQNFIEPKDLLDNVKHHI